MLSARKRFFLISSIIIICAIGFFSSDIYIPIMPKIAAYFHETPSMVQYTMSAFLLGMAIFQIPIGFLGDKYGKKNILLLFILVFIAASYGCYLAKNLEALILFRFLQSIGACAGISIGQALIVDFFHSKERPGVFSIVVPLVAFSPAIAPLLGAKIDEMFSWREIFLFLIFYGIVCSILLWSPIFSKKNQIQHSIKDKDTTFAENDFAKPFLEKGSHFDKWTFPSQSKKIKFCAYATFMMASNATYFAFLASSPFVLNTMGYSPFVVSLAICASSFPYILSSLFSKKISHKFNSDQIIGFGLCGNALGVFFLWMAQSSHWNHVGALMIPVFVVSVGNGLVMPFSSSQAVSLFPKRAALVTGCLGSAQMFAASLATKCVGLFEEISLRSLAIFDTVVIFCAVVFYLIVFYRVSEKIRNT